MKPEQPPIINAFHPDYVKMYMPEFISEAKSKHKAVDLDTKPRFDVEPRPYYTYSKAGVK